MPKLRGPILSLGARGGLTKLFSLARRGGRHIIERKPIPTDAKSPAQLFNRHMFNKCIDLWHLLSEAEKAEWERLATPRHMTGYAWYISQCLRPNPGIYLPLQGGTMSGNIDMDGNLIDGLSVVPRHKFIPLLSGYPGANSDVSGTWQHANIIFKNNLVPLANISLKVPDDFVSFDSIKLLWMASAAAGNIYWQIWAKYGAPGEAPDTHSDTPAFGATPTGGAWILNLTEPPNPLTLANLAKGDYLGIQIKRFGTDPLDTLNADFYGQGILFSYQANPLLSP